MSTLFVAFEDFILSREAMLCSPETIDFYQRMLKPFLALANGSQPSNCLVMRTATSSRWVTNRGQARHATTYTWMAVSSVFFLAMQLNRLGSKEPPRSSQSDVSS